MNEKFNHTTQNQVFPIPDYEYFSEDILSNLAMCRHYKCILVCISNGNVS